MIKTKLMILEYNATRDPMGNKNELEAIYSVNKILSKIDFNVEIVPMDNMQRMLDLLVSLKQKPLTADEVKLVEKIVME